MKMDQKIFNAVLKTLQYTACRMADLVDEAESGQGVANADVSEVCEKVMNRCARRIKELEALTP